MAITSASSIIIRNADKVFIQLFWGAQQVGEYFAVFNLSSFILNFSAAVAVLLLPTVSEYHAKNNLDDIRRLTYCMKDVYNWKIYTDLYDSFTKVDYTQLLETEDNTVGIEEISCAGGACLI